MEKENKSCQSCGMPMRQDPQGGGINADGTKNRTYCSYCFQNGEFTYKTNDVKDFQEKCKRIMIEKGMAPWKAWLFTRGMKRLGRWKN